MKLRYVILICVAGLLLASSLYSHRKAKCESDGRHRYVQTHGFNGMCLRKEVVD
jgi:hypothetical protein